jgi:hypothetical protein
VVRLFCAIGTVRHGAIVVWLFSSDAVAIRFVALSVRAQRVALRLRVRVVLCGVLLGVRAFADGDSGVGC